MHKFFAYWSPLLRATGENSGIDHYPSLSLAAIINFAEICMYNHNPVYVTHPSPSCPTSHILISTHPLCNYPSSHNSSTNSAFFSWHWGPATSGLSRAPSLSIILGHISHFISHHSCWDPSLETKVSLSPCSNPASSLLYNLYTLRLWNFYEFFAAIPIL